jgi:hypothetical protein
MITDAREIIADASYGTALVNDRGTLGVLRIPRHDNRETQHKIGLSVSA